MTGWDESQAATVDPPDVCGMCGRPSDFDLCPRCEDRIYDDDRRAAW